MTVMMMRGAFAVASKTMQQQMKVQKHHYDQKVKDRKLNVGDAVWLLNPQRKKGVCPKLTSKWKKGYIVIGRLDDVVYRVQKGKQGKPQVVHINRLMKYEGSDPLPHWFRTTQGAKRD